MGLTYQLTDTCELRIEVGDLTEFMGDAIVNAANPKMLGGGGVDGAIHRAAGPELRAACKEHPIGPGGRCPPGDARLTPGFLLPAKYVIHTVGPIYEDAEESAPVLRAAYRNSLVLANEPEHGIRSVAFPAISCGVYGYPLEEAAEVALTACRAHAGGLHSITFVLFTKATAMPFVEVAGALCGPPLPEQPTTPSDPAAEGVPPPAAADAGEGDGAGAGEESEGGAGMGDAGGEGPQASPTSQPSPPQAEGSGVGGGGGGEMAEGHTGAGERTAEALPAAADTARSEDVEDGGKEHMFAR